MPAQPADCCQSVCRHQTLVACAASSTVQWQCGLPDVVQEVPHLVSMMHCKSRSVLSSCDTKLRHLLHTWTTVVVMENQDDLQILAKGYWPQLAVVVLRKQQNQPDLSQCQSVDSLQLVARFDFWQTRPLKPGVSGWVDAKSS